MKNTNKYSKICATIIAVILAMVIGMTVVVNKVRDKAASLENQVYIAEECIGTLDVHRTELIANMADCIAPYSEEDATFMRLLASNCEYLESFGDINDIVNCIPALYPELAATKMFADIMTDWTDTNDRLDECRNDYNDTVQEYADYVSTKYVSMLLDASGYEVQTFECIEDTVDE